MSTNKTPNLNMHSWSEDDIVDVKEVNENFTKVDSNLTKKTGDTMTGDLTVQKSYAAVILKKDGTSPRSGITINEADTGAYGLILLSEEVEMLLVDGSADNVKLKKNGVWYDALHKGNTVAPAYEKATEVSYNVFTNENTNTLVANGTVTKFPFNSVWKGNKPSEIRTATNDIKVEAEGTYTINAQINMYNMTGSPKVNLYLYRNGVYEKMLDVRTLATGVVESAVNGTCLMYLLAGDVLDIRYKVEGGTANAYGTWRNTYFETLRHN